MIPQTRRQFLRGSLVLTGLSLLAGCAGLPAQAPSASVRQIGYFSGSAPNSDTSAVFPWVAFQQGLLDLGYVEGQNLHIHLRNRTSSGEDPLADPAADLVRLKPEVIVTPAITDARAVWTATTTIPIVNAGNGDLVASGLAASHARPGGNVTGLSTPLLAGKQLQFFQEAVPGLARVAVVIDAAIFVDVDRQGAPYKAAADALGLQLLFVPTANPEDLEAVVATAVREHADGLFILLGPVLSGNLARISALALRSRLPSMWQATSAASFGGLLGYGPNRADLARRAATYVDRILKGAKPADLPIEQPTVFDFVINLKTAQTLGLTIPSSVLTQATEIIH